jgi:hypothetical protein
LPKNFGLDHNFNAGPELLNSGGRAQLFRIEIMVTLLEAVALLILAAISLTGFAAAVAWTFAVWFGNRG